MRGYSRAEEDLDEYENDELDEYEDTEGDKYGYAEEEEPEVEQEDPMPKKEEQEYLELRQKLKEEARKKLAKQSGSSSSVQDVKRSKPENFGSFFGPSRPVISARVIQESKSYLETRQERPRVSSCQIDSRKSQVSGLPAPKNGLTEGRLHNPVKTKVQKLKDTRDYSFLLSDDADVPTVANVLPSQSNLESAQGSSKSRESGHTSRQIPNVTGERRPGVVNSHIRSGQNSVHQKPSPSIRPDSRKPERSAAPEHKKYYPASGHGNGTARPAIPKEAPLRRDAHLLKKVQTGQLYRKVISPTERRAPILSIVKKPSPAVSKVAVSNGKPQQFVKASIHGVRQRSEERAIKAPKGNYLSKQASPSLRLQMQAPKRIPPSRYSREDSYGSKQQLQKPKPKPVRRFPDEEDDDGQQAILEIRKMFRYNPNRYAGDDDDLSDMEADFSTIQMEEKRSALIAREEDERELALIQEEEEREKRRKLAKKRKVGQP